jgi:energy-coupling factor transporter ATP-binding protein EcfA2
VALLELHDVHFAYPHQDQETLRGLNLTIERGEFVAIFGEAKSTFVLCLTGAIPHLQSGRFSGRVVVGGVETTTVRVGELARTVGMVLQDPENQLFNLTVESDIVFGMENLRVPREEMAARLEQALTTVRMAEFRHRMSMELSGGQKQRVAIAAVLAMRPPILVLDEPTRELDPLGTEEVFEVLGRLKQQGTTIVLVENDPDHVAPLADRMVYLRDGVVAEEGPPREFYRRVWGDSRIRFPQVTELFLRLEQEGVLGGGDGQQDGPRRVPITVEDAVPIFERYVRPGGAVTSPRTGQQVDRT